MLDQHEDGSHEFTLHNVCCPGCQRFPNTAGVLKWSAESGITFILTFNGIHGITGTPYFARHRANRGVGR